VKYLSVILKELNENAKQIANISYDESDTMKMRRDFNMKQLEDVTSKIGENIERIKSSVQVKVSQALENELDKIDALIDEFNTIGYFYTLKQSG